MFHPEMQLEGLLYATSSALVGWILNGPGYCVLSVTYWTLKTSTNFERDDVKLNGIFVVFGPGQCLNRCEKRSVVYDRRVHRRQSLDWVALHEYVTPHHEYRG